MTAQELQATQQNLLKEITFVYSFIFNKNMFRSGYKFNKVAQRLHSRESFHTEFKFRPFNVYRIVSSDGKWVISIKNAEKDGSEDKFVYVIPNDPNNIPEGFSINKQYVFIDSDTGCIAFFDSVMPYLSAKTLVESSKMTHYDCIEDQSNYMFDKSGAIQCKLNPSYYIATQSVENTVNYLMVMPKSEYQNAAIKTWKYEFQFDCRQYYNEHLTMIENSEIQNTTNQTIDSLKKLNDAYLRRANVEIDYRDGIIKDYESNWLIKNLMNRGKMPKTEVISQRTFAKAVAADAEKEQYKYGLPSFAAIAARQFC